MKLQAYQNFIHYGEVSMHPGNLFAVALFSWSMHRRLVHLPNPHIFTPGLGIGQTREICILLHYSLDRCTGASFISKHTSQSSQSSHGSFSLLGQYKTTEEQSSNLKREKFSSVCCCIILLINAVPPHSSAHKMQAANVHFQIKVSPDTILQKMQGQKYRVRS